MRMSVWGPCPPATAHLWGAPPGCVYLPRSPRSPSPANALVLISSWKRAHPCRLKTTVCSAGALVLQVHCYASVRLLELLVASVFPLFAFFSHSHCLFVSKKKKNIGKTGNLGIGMTRLCSTETQSSLWWVLVLYFTAISSRFASICCCRRRVQR